MCHIVCSVCSVCGTKKFMDKFFPMRAGGEIDEKFLFSRVHIISICISVYECGKSVCISELSEDASLCYVVCPPLPSSRQ